MGDGGGLTGVVGSGSGVIVKDGGSLVETAGTIDFSTNLSLSPISGGITTVTAATGTSYANSDVDTHLNQSTANAGEVLSWSGSDYDWISNAGYSDSSVDTHLNQSTANSNEVLSWNGVDYDWIAQTSGTTTFTGLTDTPANFTSQAGKYVRVNSGANALEFVTPLVADQ